MSFNVDKLKNFDIENFIKNIWKKIDDADKKSFLVFFLMLNFVYFCTSIFCLFGNNDISTLYDRIDLWVSLSYGRYSVSFIEYILSDKTIIPMFINIILFLFLSITIILILNWFKFKKSLFTYISVGLFFLVSPFIYNYIGNCTFRFGILITQFFMISSFFLILKMNGIKNRWKKFFLFLLSVLLLTVFVFGAYQPVLGVIIGLLFCKIIMECIDSNFKDIFKIIKDKKYEFLMIVNSIIFTFFIMKILFFLGFINENSYHIQLTEISELSNNFLFFLSESLKRFVLIYPFVDLKYRVVICFIILLSFFSVLLKICKNAKGIKECIKNLFLLLFIFFTSFIIFNLIYFVSGTLLFGYIIYRLEYWTNFYFSFIWILLGTKYSNGIVHSFISLLLVFLVLLGIQTNYNIQKTQFIGLQHSLYCVNDLKKIIFSNNNYNAYLRYKILTIGRYNPLFYSKYQYQLQDLESINTFLSIIYTDTPFPYIPPKMQNIKAFPFSAIFSYESLEQNVYITSNLKKYLLKDARAYPAENCIYIDKNVIFIVLDNDVLEEIRKNIEKKDI